MDETSPPSGVFYFYRVSQIGRNTKPVKLARASLYEKVTLKSATPAAEIDPIRTLEILSQ